MVKDLLLEQIICLYWSKTFTQRSKNDCINEIPCTSCSEFRSSIFFYIFLIRFAETVRNFIRKLSILLMVCNFRYNVRIFQNYLYETQAPK